MEFAGKVALVTGGASGIGHATALALARGGATVYIGDINEEAGRAAAQQMGKEGAATFLRLDVTSDTSVADARFTIQKKHEALDILVNAAGWSKIERFVDTGETARGPDARDSIAPLRQSFRIRRRDPVFRERQSGLPDGSGVERERRFDHGRLIGGGYRAAAATPSARRSLPHFCMSR